MSISDRVINIFKFIVLFLIILWAVNLTINAL